MTYNGQIFTAGCEDLRSQADCESRGCFWYDNACHSTVICEDIRNEPECISYGCYWWDFSCHSSTPTCDALNTRTECAEWGCYWYNTACHSTPQATDICTWVSDQGGPSYITINAIFEIIDAYLFSTPPAGYTFVPTIQQIFGVIDYYLGFDGDAKTGCDFF